jgi:dodecin
LSSTLAFQKEKPARWFDDQEQRDGASNMAVARVSKVTAASAKGFQDAAEEGLKRATQTLRGVTGFEVISLKGKVQDGKITEYRTTLEVTFILE